LIEVSSKEEIKRISTSTTEKCGKELAAKVQELRNPRLVICNIPEDVTLENATKTIRKHNSELQLEKQNIMAKFTNRTKRNARNLVIEVNSHTRKQILNTRMNIGWVICNVDDYIRERKQMFQMYQIQPQACRLQRRGDMSSLYRKTQTKGMHIIAERL